MEWIHIQNFVIFINLMIIVYMFIKFAKCKSCEQTITILNKNVDLLNSVHRKQYSNDLKKMIELYSEVQTILKVSNSSFISLFRYDYSKTYITLHFMFSVNDGGEIMHESYLDKLPATSNLLNLKILKSNCDGLCNLKTDSFKDVDVKIYQILKYRNIEKTYYKNINKNSNTPLGYIAFSYQDDYELDDRQREEILRIILKISELL